jgi:hypothetical protein
MSASRGAPRVSVVIPVFNLRTFLPEAIESVLAQTVPADVLETVVVDDGSTDGSGEVAARYAPRVRLLRQPNRGLPAARNAGLRATAAPFLTFLDADDRLLPEKLATELAVLDAHPETGLVYSGWHFIDETGRRLPQRGWSREEGDVLPRLVLGNLIHPHAALVRREAVERAGGFDERLTSVEDWDLWLRLSRAGLRWRLVDRPLAEYRIRPGAMHENAARMLENRLHVLDRFFADPALPPSVAALRPQAYQNAYLAAACDHYRAGTRAPGASAFRAAVAARPAIVTDPRGLRLICRWLLPLGSQSEASVAARAGELAATLRLMLADLFAAGAPGAEVARLRWQVRVAWWRTLARLRRKQALTTLGLGTSGTHTRS